MTRVTAELARDNTATGLRQAALARASRPTSQAKAETWEAVINDASLPNAMIGSMIGGFLHPDQVDLLEPYIEKYFEVAATIWSLRTQETATDILMGLYPVYSVHQSMVAAADTFLARTDLEPTVRRLVSEGRDSTVRALNARACDAS